MLILTNFTLSLQHLQLYRRYTVCTLLLPQSFSLIDIVLFSLQFASVDIVLSNLFISNFFLNRMKSKRVSRNLVTETKMLNTKYTEQLPKVKP